MTEDFSALNAGEEFLQSVVEAESSTFRARAIAMQLRKKTHL